VVGESIDDVACVNNSFCGTDGCNRACPEQVSAAALSVAFDNPLIEAVAALYNSTFSLYQFLLRLM